MFQDDDRPINRVGCLVLTLAALYLLVHLFVATVVRG